MGLCIECDEESKNGVPLNNFEVGFKDGGGKKNRGYTLIRQCYHHWTF